MRMKMKILKLYLKKSFLKKKKKSPKKNRRLMPLTASKTKFQRSLFQKQRVYKVYRYLFHC